MARTGALLRQAPLTVALAVVAVLVGAVTGSLWSPLAGRPLRADLAEGVGRIQKLLAEAH